MPDQSPPCGPGQVRGSELLVRLPPFSHRAPLSHPGPGSHPKEMAAMWAQLIKSR